MNNDLLIIDEEKAYRRVDWLRPECNDVFLGSDGFVQKAYRRGDAKRMILEPTDNPYILREDAEALRLAAKDLLQTRIRLPQGTSSDRFSVSHDTVRQLQNAVSEFPPPEAQERWRWESDSIFDGDTEFNLANVEGCTELVAALNELNNQLETEK